MKIQVTVLSIINVIAFMALLYMFDVFGIVNYYSLMRSRVQPNLPSFVTKFTRAPRIEDTSVLGYDDMEKMREGFQLREKDIQAQEQLLSKKAIELNSQTEVVEQDKTNLLLAWSNYQATLDERNDYQVVLSDLASKIGAMPPQNSVALINELAASGSDELVIDVLLEMDAIAEAEGRNSITSFLLSLLEPQVAARILEKYERRTAPSPLEVPPSPNDFAVPSFD